MISFHILNLVMLKGSISQEIYQSLLSFISIFVNRCLLWMISFSAVAVRSVGREFVNAHILKIMKGGKDNGTLHHSFLQAKRAK